ncbi:MAG TPA: hypothetical protein V6D06_04375 [Trichocoleus sp.]
MTDETNEREEDEKTEVIAAPGRRHFNIPNCTVTVQTEGANSISVEELLSIVFTLAHDNPNAEISFWLQVKPPKVKPLNG